MFIRAKMVGGRTYYAAVVTYRDGRRVRQWSAPLGREPDIGRAVARAEARLRPLTAALRRLAVIYPTGDAPAWAAAERRRLERSLAVWEGRLTRLREAEAALSVRREQGPPPLALPEPPPQTGQSALPKRAREVPPEPVRRGVEIWSGTVTALG